VYFKKLAGKKCYLSPIDLADTEKFTEWMNDLEVTINLGPIYHMAVNADSERKFLDDLAKGHNYSIVDMATGALIGSCGFHEIDHLNRAGEVGIAIGDKGLWGKGYGTEAMRLLLDYGFRALNLHSVLIRVFPFNERAIRCYEKLGFRIIGRRRQAVIRDLKTHDIVLMDILAEEFYANRM